MSNRSPTAGTRPMCDSRNPPTVSNPSRSIGTFRRSHHFVDVDLPAEQEAAVAFVDDRLGLDVVLVADLADDLLEQIFDRHQAGRAAVLVDDDRALLLLPLELLEQLGHALGLGHDERRAQQRA